MWSNIIVDVIIYLRLLRELRLREYNFLIYRIKVYINGLE